jgi:hypothetical protein
VLIDADRIVVTTVATATTAVMMTIHLASPRVRAAGDTDPASP